MSTSNLDPVATKMSPRRVKAANVGLMVPAVIAMVMSADTTYRFLGTTLDIHAAWERAALSGVVETAIIALTIYAWATRTKAAAWLAYGVVGIQAVAAFSLSGLTGGLIRSLLGPALLAVMLHLLLKLDLKAAGQRSDGLMASVAREVRERFVAWLGLGRRGEDSAAIARSRAADRAVSLADSLAAAKPGSRSARRTEGRMAAALDAACHGLDEDGTANAKAAIRDRVIARKSVSVLANTEQRDGWDRPAGQTLFPTPEAEAPAANISSANTLARPRVRPVSKPRVRPTSAANTSNNKGLTALVRTAIQDGAADRAAVVAAVLAVRPDANRRSLAATVRREMKQ